MDWKRYVSRMIVKWQETREDPELKSVKAQVRDLRYNSGNLYPNCIIRHMLRKWTDHPSGICGWGGRMTLKGLGIRKCVSSGLASCMFTIRCISIIFCCSLFMCYYWTRLGICSCISAWVRYVASQAEPLCVCQTVGVWIGKRLPN